ncbi:hypothetical protein EJ08DRAFT_480959 [Tothia fuscella]|uniref:Uncharacterized protein n=1 Tax=Tothia fuscella TaxID=1048955 RepID=A0A9P4NHR0_9PEZI|nr:hypothetical protein EJ08DRAFT_480959 [Tothia fuscella]
MFPVLGNAIPGVSSVLNPATDALKNLPLGSVANTAQGLAQQAAAAAPGLPLSSIPVVGQVVDTAAPVVGGVVGTALNTAPSAPLNLLESAVPGVGATSPVISLLDAVVATVLAVISIITHTLGLDGKGILGPAVPKSMARGDPALEELLKRQVLPLAAGLPVDPTSLVKGLPVVGGLTNSLPVVGGGGAGGLPVVGGLTNSLPIIGGGGAGGLPGLDPSLITGLLGGFLGNVPGLNGLTSPTGLITSLITNVVPAITTLVPSDTNNIPGVQNLGPITALFQTLTKIDATKYAGVDGLTSIDAIESVVGSIPGDKLAGLQGLPALSLTGSPLDASTGLLKAGDAAGKLGVTPKQVFAFEIAKGFGLPI